MRNWLIAIGVVTSIIGAVLMFTSGDTFSLILELIGLALSAVGFFIRRTRG